MAAKYQVNWDNGGNACGTFPNVFDTEEAAQAFADEWAAEMNATDPDACEDYTAEVIEVELEELSTEETMRRALEAARAIQRREAEMDVKQGDFDNSEWIGDISDQAEEGEDLARYVLALEAAGLLKLESR